ncbi:MAG: DUF4359 domain-containing protein [Halanaerobiales bacterium]|nr:DUF4359 domain-containing protein [Halanaerobiales bacterium]
MKNFMIFLILVLVAASFLAITNPTNEDFVNWGVQKMQSDAETDFERILEGTVGEQLLKLRTSRSNYVIFSVFNVESADETIKYLGIVNLFFQISN